MALYFPPLFCDKGSILKARNDFEIELEDSEILFLRGETFKVDDLFGYGYNISSLKSGITFRIMNSSMPDYFEILEKKEVKLNLSNFGYDLKEGQLATLLKDFEIADVIKIPKDEQFLCFKSYKSDELLYDLFSTVNFEKVLRLKKKEFIEYFEG